MNNTLAIVLLFSPYLPQLLATPSVCELQHPCYRAKQPDLGVWNSEVCWVDGEHGPVASDPLVHVGLISTPVTYLLEINTGRERLRIYIPRST